MTRARLLLVLLAATVVTAGCAGDYNRYPRASSSAGTTTTTTRPPAATTPSTTTTTTTTTTTAPPGGAPSTTTPTAPPGVAPGRLAIIADDGSVVTVRADGSQLTTVAGPPDGGANLQPTWAPDASMIAWSSRTPAEGALRVAAPDGSSPTRQAITPPPFYLAWNKDQKQLLYLRSPAGDSVELGLADPTAVATSTAVRTGSPLYASWSPDGTRVLVHAGDADLLVVDTSGTATTLPVRVGPSTAPVWLAPDTVLIAIRTNADQRLTVLNIATGVQRDLLTYQGQIQYVVDPTNAKVAYQVVPQQGGGGGGSIVSFPFGQSTGAVPAARPNELTVVDIASGTATTVATQAAVAFQWSPQGDRLAFLAGAENNTARWRFWSTAGIIDGVAYLPSQATAEQYLPFFEQYAQSIRWWSPDGRAFAFAGRLNGRDGVWVQGTQAGATATRVSDGQVVVWSPR